MDSRAWGERGLRDAVLDGNEDAWQILYDWHFDALYTVVYFHAGRDTFRTEEAVQDCWLVAVPRKAAFDPDRAPFDAWLRGVALKVLAKQCRFGTKPPDLSHKRRVNPKTAVECRAFSEQHDTVSLIRFDLEVKATKRQPLTWL